MRFFGVALTPVLSHPRKRVLQSRHGAGSDPPPSRLPLGSKGTETRARA